MNDDERTSGDIGHTSVLLGSPAADENQNGSCCCEPNETRLQCMTTSAFKLSESSVDVTQTAPGDKTEQKVHISDLLGEYGNYQLFLTVVTFVRYVCLAMMTNTGPLIAPSLAFWCQLPMEQQQTSASNVAEAMSLIRQQESRLLSHFSNFTTQSTGDNFLKNKCFLSINDSLASLAQENNSYKCTQWTYDRTKSGITLTEEFSLICDRTWLRSAFQSSISIGVAVASVMFGASSDEHGRRITMHVSLVASFLAGLASYWAPSFLVFTLTRSLCTMCDLCIAGSLYTIIVETLGNKYRGIVCLIVTTGWSIGVMVMPWVTGYYRDFRKVMLFTVACHVITIPWLLIVKESPRWLLINGRIDEARHQIQCICRKWNRKSHLEMLDIDDKFEVLKLKYLKGLAKTKSDKANDADEGFRRLFRLVVRTLFGGFSKIGELFKSRELIITTSVFIWIIFNSELLYMFFIFNNSDHDDNVKLNYAIGGLMESLATLLSIIMISSLTRRLSLSLTLTLVSLSMVSYAFTFDQPKLSIYTLNITKLAGSSLTSLVFVVITELFPTSVRQTGTGISTTLGSCGAIVAPFVHNEFAQLIGFRNVMFILCVMSLSAAILVPFFLRETKGVELPDEVDEIENCKQAQADKISTGPSKKREDSKVNHSKN